MNNIRLVKILICVTQGVPTKSSLKDTEQHETSGKSMYSRASTVDLIPLIHQTHTLPRNPYQHYIKLKIKVCVLAP